MKTIQREPDLPKAKPVEKPASQAENSIVQREMDRGQDHGGESLSDLLKGLPTHYEMPKEQIEAIRSGKPYVRPQHSVTGSQAAAVQRELSDKLPKPTGHADPSENRPRKSGPHPEAAAVQKTVQRETELVLPKQKTGSAPDKGTPEPVVQRESASKPAASRADSLPGKLPGSPVLPMGSFAPNGFMGSGGRSGSSENGSFGAQPGLVQREPLDMDEPPTIQRELPDTGNAQASSSDEAEKADGEMPQIVSARQLDALADKLVPRIKRMMRAEMERGVFR